MLKNKNSKAMLHIGYSNYVVTEKITGIFTNDTSPVKKLVSRAKANEAVVDLTKDKATRSVILMDDGVIILSAINPATLVQRVQEGNNEENMLDEEVN